VAARFQFLGGRAREDLCLTEGCAISAKRKGACLAAPRAGYGGAVWSFGGGGAVPDFRPYDSKVPHLRAKEGGRASPSAIHRDGSCTSHRTDGCTSHP
jgi:hypothetical protein